MQVFLLATSLLIRPAWCGWVGIKKMTINNKEEERVELNNRDASQFYEREGEEGLLLLAPSRS